MSEPATHLLLERMLRDIPRRYRLPELPELARIMSTSREDALPDKGPVAFAASQADGRPATLLAIVIEHARRSLAAGDEPDPTLKPIFIDALAALIREAMEAEAGDPAFQAMVLKHRSPVVREYALLVARRQQDRRRIHGRVNAVAHPAKLHRLPPGLLRDTLAQLQSAATALNWPAAIEALRRLLTMPETQDDPHLQDSLKPLHDEPALRRLQRLETLRGHEEVRQYLALWEQQGPRANSHAAAIEGAAGRRRGTDVETLATQALQALAQRLNAAQAHAAPYRVVTSMHVPASLTARREGAKTEWDAVLLKRAPGAGATSAWDISLLLEAKASADAVGTDFPRLLRGLRLLAHADADQMYPFKAREGVISLRGASLNALPTDPASLETTVLYCSDAPADKNPRLLSAAGRMQLLSAPESLAFGAALAQAQHADSRMLEPLWQKLLRSAQWKTVLLQYPALRQARELMVHTEDLLAGAGRSSEHT